MAKCLDRLSGTQEERAWKIGHKEVWGGGTWIDLSK